MKFLFMFVALLIATPGYSQDRQAELDRQCEDARQIALGPVRQEVFKDCLAKGKEESVCKREAAEYNGARADRGPMFYDLPECEAAFNYRKHNDD